MKLLPCCRRHNYFRHRGCIRSWATLNSSSNLLEKSTLYIQSLKILVECVLPVLYSKFCTVGHTYFFVRFQTKTLTIPFNIILLPTEEVWKWKLKQRYMVFIKFRNWKTYPAMLPVSQDTQSYKGLIWRSFIFIPALFQLLTAPTGAQTVHLLAILHDLYGHVHFQFHHRTMHPLLH